MLLTACSTMPRATSIGVTDLPMYGGALKTSEQKAADEELIRRTMAMGYTREQGSDKSVELGWKYFAQGDLATAMKRFNQAWLLNPENGNAFHGFAVVAAQRGGNTLEAERLFKQAIAKPNVTTTAFVDYARFLNMNGRFNEAVNFANQALTRKQDTPNARSQISYSYFSMMDYERACIWARKAVENQDHLETNYLPKVCGNRPQ
jgi:Tfp pilus assembly protein PilF